MDEQAQKYVSGLKLVERGMSIHKAAKKIGVPFENLRARAKGEVPVACRTGPMLVYLSTGADQGLLEVIEHRAAWGLCVGFAELRFLIRQAAIVSAVCPVSPTFPGRSFVTRWSKRHSDSIVLREARVLQGCRAEASTADAVQYYYDNLAEALDELKLHDRPSQIWNCDETGVCAQGRCHQRVFALKGCAANVRRSADRENVSVMGCINAAGGHVPPMYIFAGRRRKVEWMKVAPEGAVCAMSDSSNINGAIFMHGLKWFVGELPMTRRQLLILDGHFAHVNYDAVVWAMSRDVHLFVLSAHTSHFLQPLDVGIYQTYKQLYEKELEQYQLREGLLPTRDDIAALTKVPFELAFSAKNARKAFEKAGIYPLCIDKMLGGLVGNTPSTDKASLRHHSVVVPQVELLEISDRQRQQLERRGLSADALNVVNIAVRTSVTSMSKKRSGGTYVDEQYSGGVLLTHTEMLDALQRKKRAELDKEQAKEERAMAKERAKVGRAVQAAEKQRTKDLQAQERLRSKGQRCVEVKEAKKQRALEKKRRKNKRLLQSLRQKEARVREKDHRQRVKREAKLHKVQQEPTIVASALV